MSGAEKRLPPPPPTFPNLSHGSFALFSEKIGIEKVLCECRRFPEYGVVCTYITNRRESSWRPFLEVSFQCHCQMQKKSFLMFIWVYISLSLRLVYTIILFGIVDYNFLPRQLRINLFFERHLNKFYFHAFC